MGHYVVVVTRYWLTSSAEDMVSRSKWPRYYVCGRRLGSMTAIGELNIIPIREGSMSGEIAKAIEALEAFDITYETNPMGTILEADTAHELFAAAEAAHEAVDEDRVITTVKIDDKRTVQQRASEKVTVVEARLGRKAKRWDE